MFGVPLSTVSNDCEDDFVKVIVLIYAMKAGAQMQIDLFPPTVDTVFHGQGPISAKEGSGKNNIDKQVGVLSTKTSR